MIRMRAIIILVVAITAIAGAWFFWGGEVAVSMPSLSLADGHFAREVPTGYKEYRSERYRFSLFVPENMQVMETDEGGGASTITFEDTDAGVGFQLFVVPYFASQITEERFRQDVPSGVRERERAATIGGVQGSTFYSKSDALGETFEVWFIHNELLYEATTLAPLDSWLSDIMKYWQFI